MADDLSEAIEREHERQGGVLVVLGSPNADDGSLSAIARSRCDRAAELWRERPSRRLILTGGFGEHFNRTDQPHTTYLRRYLVERRHVSEDAILDCVSRSNTAEDARLVRSVFPEARARELRVVTSDFHVERAKLLFEREFGVSIRVDGAPTPVDDQEREQLERHEREAIARLR